MHVCVESFCVYPQCSHNSQFKTQNFAQTPVHQPEWHWWDWRLGERWRPFFPLQVALRLRVPAAAHRRAPAPSTALLLPKGGTWGRALTSNCGTAWVAWSKLLGVLYLSSAVLFQDSLYIKQWETSTSRGARRARKRALLLPVLEMVRGCWTLVSVLKTFLKMWTFRNSGFSPRAVADVRHTIVQPHWVCLNSMWRTKPVALKHAHTEVLVNCLLIVTGLLWHLKGFALGSHHVCGQE